MSIQSCFPPAIFSLTAAELPPPPTLPKELSSTVGVETGQQCPNSIISKSYAFEICHARPNCRSLPACWPVYSRHPKPYRPSLASSNAECPGRLPWSTVSLQLPKYKFRSWKITATKGKGGFGQRSLVRAS